MKFDKLQSFVKNNPRGNILGAVIFLSAFLGLYIITEISFKEKKEVFAPNVDLKMVKGDDNTKLSSKEKQLKAYIEEDKQREKDQDFFIKSAYYINDNNKRIFDGKTLNIKDLEIVEDKIKEEKIEPPKIVVIEEPKIELPTIEAPKIREEEIVEPIKIEIEKAKPEDLLDFKPNMSTLEDAAKLQYKMDRLTALSLMLPVQTYQSESVFVQPNIILDDSNDNDNIIKEDRELYIKPGSSFYGYLENNLNSLVSNSIAIITFTSKELKGYKGIGKAITNKNTDGLSIVVDQIITPKGKRIPSTAFAIDTKQFSATFADDVDSKTLKKFALVSSSIVLNAFGSAKSDSESSGTTTTTTDFSTTSTTPVQNFQDLFYGNLATNTGEKIDEYLVDELANTHNEIKVNSGKNLVIIFY